VNKSQKKPGDEMEGKVWR